jgi:hypothetical protein
VPQRYFIGRKTPRKTVHKKFTFSFPQKQEFTKSSQTCCNTLSFITLRFFLRLSDYLGLNLYFSLSLYRTNEVGKIKQENSTFFVGWVIFFHLDVSVAKLTNSNIPTKEQVWKSYSIPKC